MSYSLPISARDFTNFPSWANNCLANKATNGVDLKPSGSASRARARAAHVASIRSRDTVTIIGRSHPFDSTLSPINRSISGLESHILPQNKTGVVRALRCRPIPYIMHH